MSKISGPPADRHTFRNVSAMKAGKPEVGDLGLKDFHLNFRVPAGAGEHAQKQAFLAYQLISWCTVRPTTRSSGIPSSIRIRFRDFTYVCFNFTDDKDARCAFDFIRARTCRLGSIDRLLAFSWKPTAVEEAKINGWVLYDPRAEFRRQGISEKSADLGWRVSTINKDYVFSPTYPAVLAVPSRMSDNTLKYAASFRSRARIPTLTYLHPVNKCTITRSSQPFVGLRMKRSLQDERLVGACFSASDSLDTSSSASVDQSSVSQVDLSGESDGDLNLSETERMEDELMAGSDALHDDKAGKRLVYGAQQNNLIVDARPAINSYAMQAIGMGSENMEHYKFAKKVFLNIDNIHVMRESLDRVVNAIKDADLSPFPPNKDSLTKSKWLKHIGGILDGSTIVARQVGILHSHVLIHCSDGWDRTSQLCALSQIMLDPFYRTLDGFIVLVEKDWLSFGHMFQMRSGPLGHESWFTVDNEALAGAAVRPSETDGKTDALENALASAKRLWNTLGEKKGEKEKGSHADADDALAADDVKPLPPSVIDAKATSLKNISPVFHQFLDATYQLLRQHPTRFEFNERFLRRLLYHVYSCQYGTFLCNNERERHEVKVQERTRSVWSYFLSRRREFTNEQYESTIDDHKKDHERLLFPQHGEVRWWHQVFNCTDDEMNGELNASAATAERVAAYRSAAASGIPNSSSVDGGSRSEPPVVGASSPSKKPKPQAPADSKSVLVGVESAHGALMPDKRSVSMDSTASVTLTNDFSVLGIGVAAGESCRNGAAEKTSSCNVLDDGRAGGSSRDGREMQQMG